jgi:2-polyprenyl-6-hydroxyphenyl methylase/3-demethylubiquinone-9 3-methyltransferase
LAAEDTLIVTARGKINNFKTFGYNRLGEDSLSERRAMQRDKRPSRADGGRFAFGRNWQRFLRNVDEERIAQAEESLRRLLQCKTLGGRTFLDVGCGSGLFSLAARRLGASVRSFDYDEHSVACCDELKRRYFPDDDDWKVELGSVLDRPYLEALPVFDVVYSWGVLHHTGDMWQAMANLDRVVKPGGALSIAIYNDQGGATRRWKAVKRLYSAAPPLRLPLVLTIGAWSELKQMLIRLVRLKNPLPFADWAALSKQRGMSPWHDLVDWVGGYPFEAARPEVVFGFWRERGYELRVMTTQGAGHGCNEFTFVKAT